MPTTVDSYRQKSKIGEIGRIEIMKFISPLIAVTDMERAKAFYKKYFGLEVEVDFSANVTLTGGLSLQTLDS